MLKLITLVIFSLPLIAQAKSPANYFQLRNVVNELTQKELVNWVNELVSISKPSRRVGQAGHEAAREYLQQEIRKLDSKNSGKLSLQTFSPEKVKLKGENIIWEKTGIKDDKKLIIVSHYDTFSPSGVTSMPGANDNASGVAVALGLIRNLARMELNYTVQVVLLDWSGPDLLGSLHHAQTLAAQNILGVINLLMLGQDSTHFDKAKKLGNMKAYIQAQGAEEKWAQEILKHGPAITSKVNFELMVRDFKQDNLRYSKLGIFTVTFTQNWEEDFNPKFHQTPLDTPETLNHATLYHGYQFISGVVIGKLLDITK